MRRFSRREEETRTVFLVVVLNQSRVGVLRRVLLRALPFRRVRLRWVSLRRVLRRQRVHLRQVLRG